MKALVLAMFIFKFMSAIRAEREERWRVAGLPNRKMYMRRYRRRLKIEARIARLEVRRTALAEQIAQCVERVRLKEMHMRRRATTQAGFSAGWLAASTDSAPTKEDNWSTRYRVAWGQAHSERQRVDARMEAQQAPKPTVRVIQL
jgi:hypothetical protein